MFSRLFNSQFDKARPTWLCVADKRLELDGYCADLGLAFEHNGLQHYVAGLFCGDLEKRVMYDLRKQQLCKDHGVKLIVIPALFSKLPLAELKPFIVDRRREFGLEIPNPNAEPEYVGGFVEYQAQLALVSNIAKSKGGKCLSPNYHGWNRKLRFECSCGFNWKASPNTIKNGRWCPRCAGKVPPTLTELQALAQSRGGNFLSTSYANNHDKLQWECASGHVWLASYNTIKDAGHWCPTCGVMRRAKSRHITIEVYKDAAKRKGGLCLSPSIDSCFDKLEFECAHGHRWFGRADQVKNTKQWCPVCANHKRIIGLAVARKR